MRALIAMLAVLPALSGGASAHAQLYKWVDERGVTNYSNQLPVNPADAKKLAVVEDKVSVYTPDPALLGAIEARRRDGGVSARIAELEHQLDVERRARLAAAAAPRPSDPCPAGMDCYGVSGPYYPVAVAPRFHPRHLTHLRPYYLRSGPNPASRRIESMPSRDRGRNSMHPEPKP